jgi:hypothetical protein
LNTSERSEFDGDWSSVPKKYRYLIPLAIKYGEIWGDNEVADFVDHASPHVVIELRSLAQTISQKHHFYELSSWSFEQAPDTPASMRIYNLINLIAAFDIPLVKSYSRDDKDVLLGLWSSVDAGYFGSLLADTINALGEDAAYKILLGQMSRVPDSQKASFALMNVVLNNLQRESTLDWMESFVGEVGSEDWGYLAALSHLTWERAARWLEKGRPLSLVALEAIKACIVPGSKSPLINSRKPRLGGAFDSIEVIQTLQEYQRQDPTPTVSNIVLQVTEYLHTSGANPSAD